MSRGVHLFIISLLISLGLFALIVSKAASADSRSIVDLSWPNCETKLSGLTNSGIIGVNDGLDFSVNPCLGSETQLFHNSYGLYLNTGYPGVSYGSKFRHYPNNCKPHNYGCIAYNYGYNDVLYSIKYADSQDAHSFVWWLDVETENSWTSNYSRNREALMGMIVALKSTTFLPTIGFYSYPGQWQLITKDWHNGYPDWVATASSKENIAIKYCSDSFNGGPTWLTQYTPSLDYNYNCLPKRIHNFKIRSPLLVRLLNVV
jgi:hypothetical protein